MAIEVIQTKLSEVLLIKPRVFADARGFFFESFNQQAWLDATGLDCSFVQDNHSRSVRGVLRGLHYQLPPSAQGKLVRAVSGEIFDVAVDIRRESATFGQWTGYKLSADNKLQMWIPQGFAHGFQVLSETAEVLYKATNYYSPADERCIIWNDDALSISWPMTDNLFLSTKDSEAPQLGQAELF